MNKASTIIIWVLSTGIALVAIYTAAFGIIDEIYQRSLTVAVSLIVAIFGSSLARVYQTENNKIKMGQWAIDFVLIFLVVLSIFWFSSVYDELESGLYSFLPDDLVVGCGGLLVVIEMTRRCFGWPLATFAILTIAYALL